MKNTTVDVLPKNEHYKGSEATFANCKKIISERWGAEEGERYTPDLCRTIMAWNKLGYRVKKGEKAIPSITMAEVKDSNGVVIRTVPRKVNLFFITQLDKVN